MNPKSDELLEYESDLDRYYAQIDSVIVALTTGSPDHLDSVPSNAIMDVLWLIQDRTEGMKSIADRVLVTSKECVKRVENMESQS